MMLYDHWGTTRLLGMISVVRFIEPSTSFQSAHCASWFHYFNRFVDNMFAEELNSVEWVAVDLEGNGLYDVDS